MARGHIGEAPLDGASAMAVVARANYSSSPERNQHRSDPTGGRKSRSQSKTASRNTGKWVLCCFVLMMFPLGEEYATLNEQIVNNKD